VSIIYLNNSTIILLVKQFNKIKAALKNSSNKQKLPHGIPPIKIHPPSPKNTTRSPRVIKNAFKAKLEGILA